MDALGVYSDNIVTGGAVQTLEDQSYKLFDRDTTVKDAAKMVQEYFNEKMSDHNVTTDIPQVEVFSLKDKYGYDFFVRRNYKGVNFAFADYGGRNVDGDYEIVEDMKLRAERFNVSMEKLMQLEKEEKVFVIAPESTYGVGRTETDTIKLRRLYDEGYRIATEQTDALRAYLNK